MTKHLFSSSSSSGVGEVASLQPTLPYKALSLKGGEGGGARSAKTDTSIKRKEKGKGPSACAKPEC